MKQFICAVDAGHYLGTPGKRCMAKLDPNETREWVLNDRMGGGPHPSVWPYRAGLPHIYHIQRK